MDEVDDLTDEFAARAVAGVMTQEVKEHAGSLQLARSSAICVTTRSQPCEPSFMRVAWPYDARGTMPFLLTYKQSGKTKYTLYLLAASKTIRSELNSKVTEGLTHNDHAYQQVWDYSGEQKVKGNGKKQGGQLVDLVQVLKILSRLSRQADVAVVYCQRMEDTLAKRTPVVPEYMTGYELLNAVNNDVLMGNTGAANEEAGSSSPLVPTMSTAEPEQVTEVHKNGKQNG